MPTQAIDQYGRPVESEFITASTLSAVTTLQNAAVATGVGTALPTNGYGVALIAISGTFNATITFEGQGPDGNWYQVNGRLRGGGSPAPTTTTTGLYEVNCMGLTVVRSNITGYTSGSVTVKGVAQPLSPTSDVMSLTGRNIQQNVTTIFNALAITDATKKISIDLNNLGIYSKIALIVLNTLGVSVTLNVEPKAYGAPYKYGNAATNQSVSVASSGFRQVYSAADLGFLSSPITDTLPINITAQAASAPASGALTVLLVGTLN